MTITCDSECYFLMVACVFLEVVEGFFLLVVFNSFRHVICRNGYNNIVEVTVTTHGVKVSNIQLCDC